MIPKLATALRVLRARIRAGEDLVGHEFEALYYASAGAPIKGRHRVLAVERLRNRFMLSVAGNAPQAVPIMPRKRSSDGGRRALERECVRRGLPPCAWRNPEKFGGGSA